MENNSVAVIGFGIMGRGIASLAAQHGYQVLIYDKRDPEDLLAKLKNELTNELRVKSLAPEEMTDIFDNLRFIDNLDKLQEVPLIIEAINESYEDKIDLLKTLDNICHSRSILASNTSSISIKKLALSINRQDKIAGLHFFNPPRMIPFVEVIYIEKTSDITKKSLHEFLIKIDKKYLEVKDTPGFLVNRVIFPMINEAIGIFQEGTATPKDIDTAMRKGANLPLGPLALADFIGLDTCLTIFTNLYSSLKSENFRPKPILKQMVDKGMLGRKSGKGFFEYKRK